METTDQVMFDGEVRFGLDLTKAFFFFGGGG